MSTMTTCGGMSTRTENVETGVTGASSGSGPDGGMAACTVRTVRTEGLGLALSPRTGTSTRLSSAG